MDGELGGGGSQKSSSDKQDSEKEGSHRMSIDGQGMGSGMVVSGGQQDGISDKQGGQNKRLKSLLGLAVIESSSGLGARQGGQDHGG
uniref:Uncharacterized protein n=1 Tax=Ditylenchus dipsaci TaxID=166011 RepID=A0A915EEE4_9BILA